MAFRDGDDLVERGETARVPGQRWAIGGAKTVEHERQVPTPSCPVVGAAHDGADFLSSGSSSAMISTVSPPVGIRPSRISMRPAMVSYAPSRGSSIPVSRSTSSSRVRPGTIHDRSPAATMAPSGAVVIVAGGTNEFFDQILERHDPGRPAVLIDHDRHLRRFGPQVRQECQYAGSLRDGQDRKHNFGHRYSPHLVDRQPIQGL